MENEKGSKESALTKQTIDELRINLEEAEVNKKNNSILEWEVIIISGVVGFLYKSWWIAGVSCILLLLLTRMKFLRTFFCVVFTVAWAVIGYFCGLLVEGKPAAVVFAIIAGLFSLGIHISAFKWIQSIK